METQSISSSKSSSFTLYSLEKLIEWKLSKIVDVHKPVLPSLLAREIN